MKTIPLLIITILFLNCNNPKHVDHNSNENKKQKTTKAENTQKDSLYHDKKHLTKEKSEENTDIKIIKATILKNNYSDHKDIKVVFKNQGSKTIKAIQFEWSCVNSFDEPADGKYFYGEGKYKEKAICLLRSGQIQTQHWEDFSTDADKIKEIKATYIVYTDDTKWKLNKQDSNNDKE